MFTVPTAAPTSLTSWSPPAWTDTISTTGDLIESRRELGTVPTQPIHRNECFTVALVQNDELVVVPDRIEVIRSSPLVMVSGVALTPAQAAELASLLDSALSALDTAAA